jgi:hypothetical protein
VIAKIAKIHGATFEPWEGTPGSAHRYREHKGVMSAPVQAM